MDINELVKLERSQCPASSATRKVLSRRTRVWARRRGRRILEAVSTRVAAADVGVSAVAGHLQPALSI